MDSSKHSVPARPFKLTFKCTQCRSKTFNSAEALAAHQAALGHDQEGYERREKLNSRNLTIVNRYYTASKNSTNGDKHLGHRSARDRDAGIRLDLATHKRNFTVLSEEEHGNLHGKLLAACHLSARLKTQGYRLTVEPPERKPRKERPTKEKSPEDKVNKNSEVKQLDATSPQNKPPDKTTLMSSSKPPKDKPREPIRFFHTPQSVPGSSQTRKAIALDCEMVEVMGGQDEVAFFSAVDFFTGEVLIHKYVQPTKRVVHWRTRVSGITPMAMNEATRAGQALSGWKSAQQALWKYADTNTVLIGHSLNNDLRVLRIIHPRIVDSAILSSEAVFNLAPDVSLRRIWALKLITKEFLNRATQTGGRRGHDCLEDAYSARDVVIWCLRNPGKLTVWAQNARAEHEAKMEQLRKEREARAQEEKEKKEKEKSEKEAKERMKESEMLEQTGDANSSAKVVPPESCQLLDNLELPAEPSCLAS
ncbi:hypothetical protein ASPVEDRAFT_83785 [Aspergillus versicolor CBS 583.65]|uniref:Exonuclease domain-containing protein n=1 Tax=Aspergillus versicolor CBS 583.65 TaxID=1036611 RepID=A0A1L9PLF4_ASPVE|nr:uncharacterized protein ASPVEDRAFT_83785 [Aspergillus versicolor CBS 583.65]OJJ02276.1 hypothetical protein ASPVEDRAFT_83785 [Aspergillus versicolor CBS 583.65]